MTKTINDYRIIVSGDEYRAPELRAFHLQGECSWIEGPNNKITTSRLASVRGRVVITQSGSRYILGKRAEGYETFAEVRKAHPGVKLVDCKL